jgi:hypothetical protein
MEISKVEETNQAMVSEEVRLRKTGGRVCIYYSESICVLPRLRFQICRSCPRATQYVRKNVVRSIFEHIKSFAVSLLKSMDIQLSK